MGAQARYYFGGGENGFTLTGKRLRKESGAPGEIRTPGLLLRRQPLYPAELRAHTTWVVYTGGSRGFNVARSVVVSAFEFLRVLCGFSSRTYRLKSFDSHKNNAL
jgi:hypothetical protein